MTRKDYILIAEALRIEYKRATILNDCLTSSNDSAIVLQTADSLADSLKRDNTRFNKEHFMAVVRGEKTLHSRPSRNGVQS